MATAKKLPSGRWRVRVYAGKGDDGKPKYKSITAPTKREAEYLAAEYATRRKLDADCITVGEAVDRYINSKSNVLSPTTIDGYKKIRRNQITRIEKLRLDDLTAEDLQKWVNRETTRSSAKTVSNAYGLLHSAVMMHRPDFSANVRLPRRAKPLKRDLPTSAEVIKAVVGTSIELPVLLSLWLCLRMSEVRGIKKSAIHDDTIYIDNVIVTISGHDLEKQLAKTDASRRILKLPKKLKDMIMAQDSEYATTLSEKAIYSRFKRLMKAAGYEHMRFHDIRHIAASDMNRLGITDRVAADRGGWSTTVTMRSVYQHSFSSDRELADQVVHDYYEKLIEDVENEK